ncbi:1-(5-phosphoribosyl)-5-[(5-phosphoribosylamino)methylideneamino] imidazole-4-carboxamide isomerase [Buchnera aphidicola (Eriosoma lanigerum)]|uniref:1-(5-phosphoribosyl)-5-[(5- phosphoribosylamino)methylideneamino]imidazole-4- carboxamide isomerase n=1 Tax=Buchnera aphidicola TaxID=9 RepID=UPI003464D36B
MIIPAIDLINGKVVRLYQGNYSQKKIYSTCIEQYLEECSVSGVKSIHIVDLDGAKNPDFKQYKILKSIISTYIDIHFQVGGGVRTEKDIDMLLSFGAKKIVVGSLAITNKTLIEKWLHTYGTETIVLALDIKINGKKEVCINGWQDNTGIILEDVLEYYIPFGLKYILCTDISKDGTLQGSNIQLYKEICNAYSNIAVQSSGGIGSLHDIYSLKQTGVKDIIVGRGLLEKKFTISEAITCWQKESYLA